MRYTIEELDCMEGHKFEYAFADLLCHNGWRDVDVTSGGGDYGVDVIARRGNVLYAIQCKRWNNSVGVAAVRDAAAGMDYYHCNAAAVITNHGYTKRAENMAKNIGVRLLGRDFLLELIDNYDEGWDEDTPEILKWEKLVGTSPNMASDNSNKGKKAQAKNIDKKKGKKEKTTKEKGIELAKHIYLKEGQIYLNNDKISYKGLKFFKVFVAFSSWLLIIGGCLILVVSVWQGLLFIIFGGCFWAYSRSIKKAISKYDELKTKKATHS